MTANLRDEVANLIIELTSRSLALLVELSLTGADVVFSDNYFNLSRWSDGSRFPARCLPVGLWTRRKKLFAFAPSTTLIHTALQIKRLEFFLRALSGQVTL